jgi:hypothetical protein
MTIARLGALLGALAGLLLLAVSSAPSPAQTKSSYRKEGSAEEGNEDRGIDDEETFVKWKVLISGG